VGQAQDRRSPQSRGTSGFDLNRRAHPAAVWFPCRSCAEGPAAGASASICGQRYAKRLAKGARRARRRANSSRSTRCSSISGSDRAIKHFTACSISCSWRTLQSERSKSTADPSSCRSSKTIAATSASNSSSCRPGGPTSTDASSAPTRAGGTNTTRPTSCPPNRQTPASRRCLRLPIQPPKTSPGPWRSHSSRVSQPPQPSDPAVSYALNQHTRLTRQRAKRKI
jgi:hypothetical protein